MKKLILTTAILAVGASFANADLLFDNMTAGRLGNAGTTLTSTSSTPNTFMGDGYNLIPGATSITGFDIYPVNLSGTNFDHLRINIWVWDTVNTSGTVNATTPAFSNLLGAYTLDVAGTFTTGFYFPFQTGDPGLTPGVTLGTPLAVSDSQIGMTFNYQGSTDGGVTYNSVNSLTSIISAGVPATTGSNVFNGYYRNAAGETNGNFTSSLRSIGLTNQSVGVRVYGTAVPEPASLAVLGLGLVGLVARRRRKSSK